MENENSFDERLVERILAENPVLYSKVAASLNCEPDDVPIALREVIRFLFLVSENSTGKLTPSERVDLAWHEFILCTRAYWEFCEATFGRMIHHYPGGSKESNQRQFAQTLSLYKLRFGLPDSYFWGTHDPKSAECGTCESV